MKRAAKPKIVRVTPATSRKIDRRIGELCAKGKTVPEMRAILNRQYGLNWGAAAYRQRAQDLGLARAKDRLTKDKSAELDRRLKQLYAEGNTTAEVAAAINREMELDLRPNSYSQRARRRGFRRARRISTDQSSRVNRRIRELCEEGKAAPEITAVINAETGLKLKVRYVQNRALRAGLRLPRVSRGSGITIAPEVSDNIDARILEHHSKGMLISQIREAINDELGLPLSIHFYQYRAEKLGCTGNESQAATRRWKNAAYVETRKRKHQRRKAGKDLVFQTVLAQHAASRGGGAGQRPSDWDGKQPLDRALATELLSVVGYMSNKALALRLDAAGIRCPYGRTWIQSVASKAFLQRVRRVRKWVGKPGRMAGSAA